MINQYRVFQIKEVHHQHWAKSYAQQVEDEFLIHHQNYQSAYKGKPAPTYLDGIYTAEAIGFEGKITVQVTVAEDKITDITILSAEDEEEYLARAKRHSTA